MIGQTALGTAIIMHLQFACSSYLQCDVAHDVFCLRAAGASVAAEAASASLKDMPGLGDRPGPSIPYAV